MVTKRRDAWVGHSWWAPNSAKTRGKRAAATKLALPPRPDRVFSMAVGRLSNLPDGRDLAGHSLPRTTAAADGVTLRPAQRSEVHHCLQLILGSGGRWPAEEHVVDFLRFSVYRGIDLNDIWVADHAGGVVWAILPVVSP